MQVKPGEIYTYYQARKIDGRQLHFPCVVDRVSEGRRYSICRIKMYREKYPNGCHRWVSSKRLVPQRDMFGFDDAGITPES